MSSATTAAASGDASSGCVPCATMDVSHVLEPEDIRQRLAGLPLWALDENGHLSRRFEARHFQAAMDFLNLAGAEAEAHGHHPDMKLTRYRQVEVVLYTHKLGGLTDADFQLARAIDALPVDYSAAWKVAHPAAAQQAEANAEARRAQKHSKPATAVTTATPSPGKHATRVVEDGSITTPSRRSQHRDSDAVSVHSRSSSRASSPIHSSRYSDDGSLLHEKDFVVHTGHETLAGHSDSPHYEIHAPAGPTGFQYETEAEHAAMQAHPEIRVDRHQHGHPVDGQLRVPTPQKASNGGPASSRRRPPPTPETWDHLAHALRVLRDKGYDATEAEAYLPMAEGQYIYPDVEQDFDRFYHHVLKRLTPAWRAEEPPEIVGAALEFAEAYECIRDIVA